MKTKHQNNKILENSKIKKKKKNLLQVSSIKIAQPEKTNLSNFLKNLQFP